MDAEEVEDNKPETRREQQHFDLQQKAQEERQGAEGQSDEGRSEMKDRKRIHSDEWLTVMATPMMITHTKETDLEPLDYNLDLSRELSKPQKIPIPERYVESDPEEPLSQEEIEERQHRAERIKNLLAKSNSAHNIQPSSEPLDFTDLDIAVQQQEKIMTVSHALASEASIMSKQFTAKALLSAD